MRQKSRASTLTVSKRVTSKSQNRYLGRTQTNKEERRIIKEAQRSDSGISSLDIIRVVCDVRAFSLLRVQGSLHLCEDLQETLYLGRIFGKNISRECSRKCFRDVVNLSLWKLLRNAHMRDLWVRHELIHGMLRRLGSFLRCDDTLVDSGSGK